MFLAFLGRENYNNLDISVFLEYPPNVVLEFFHQDYINIGLTVYQELKEQFSDLQNLNENVPKWILFIDKLLDMESNLESLRDNADLDFVGPAYYVKTNTRFFFYRTPFQHEGATAADIAELLELAATPSINDDVARYYATFKCRPTKKSPSEILNDLRICIQAIDCAEQINQQLCFQYKLIEEREKFLNAPYVALVEPFKPENKPVKPEKKNYRFRQLLRREAGAESFAEACDRYNHELKAYFIKYREYEKSCDRYKNALRDWEAEKNHLINRSIEDIKKAKLKIKKGTRILKIYNETLRSLDIHLSYQNPAALHRFHYFLETGRASNLQECMNLYEQESHWEEVKESQARIERNILATAFLLQPEAACSLEDSGFEPPASLLGIIKRRVKEGWMEASEQI